MDRLFFSSAASRITIETIIGWTCLFSVSSVYAFIDYEWVTIDNPGNTNDTTGFGSVGYIYRIGKYQVTIGQYTEFLNAVASTDTYSLYNQAMENARNVAGIERDGSSGNYVYTVIINDGSSANRPITNITWFNAARFANWMSNGQPTGGQNSSTTEDGAYALNGTTSGNAVVKNVINPNTDLPPTFYVPSENEWYKAAYYDPTLYEGAGGYYLFATQSDILPGNAIGNLPNQANYFSDITGFSITQSTDFSPDLNYLTDVGSYTGSASYYGTFDQNGNAWEWNDLDGAPSPSRGFRGAAYFSTTPFIPATYRIGYVPSGFGSNGGVRLAGPFTE